MNKKSSTHNPQTTEKELHWFWKLTTKWWFFPAFYVFLAFLLAIFESDVYLEIQLYGLPDGMLYTFGNFIGSLLTMSTGLLFWFQKIIPQDNWLLRLYLALFFIPLVIACTLAIYFFKHKKNKILKWLIVTSILLMVLSFLGLILAKITNFRFGGFAP